MTPQDTTQTLKPENEADEEIIRNLLHAVEENSNISQRQLATSLGIALGSVNWYLKRCINKGLIKIGQAPLRRYLYYLTPDGFEEKSRLTASYLRSSLTLFRRGRDESQAMLALCANKGWKNIVLAGDSDLAEIFVLSAPENNVTITAIIDADPSHKQRAGVSVINDLTDTNATDAIILTDMHNPVRAYEAVLASFKNKNAILIPELLKFKPQTNSEPT